MRSRQRRASFRPGCRREPPPLTGWSFVLVHGKSWTGDDEDCRGHRRKDWICGHDALPLPRGFLLHDERESDAETGKCQADNPSAQARECSMNGRQGLGTSAPDFSLSGTRGRRDFRRHRATIRCSRLAVRWMRSRSTINASVGQQDRHPPDCAAAADVRAPCCQS
jgi:hypothetical protein